MSNQTYTDELDSLVLTETTTGRQYTVLPIEGANQSQTKNAVSVAPPGRPASENILLGIQGMEGEVSIDFYVHDDGSDKANGTAPVGEFSGDTVVTLTEQRRWLMEFFHVAAFDAAWELSDPDRSYPDAMEVFVENIDVPFLQNESPKWVQASMTLRRGQSV